MSNNIHKITAAAFLLLLRGNEVLLIRRYNTGFADGYYSLPAGHVEANENYTNCLLREAKEEIGIQLDPKNIMPVHIQHIKWEWPKNYQGAHMYFVASEWQGEISNMEPDKCDDILWCNIDSLPGNTIAYIKDVIRKVSNNEMYSEWWW